MSHWWKKIEGKKCVMGFKAPNISLPDVNKFNTAYSWFRAMQGKKNKS